MDPALTGRLSRRRLLGGVAGLGIINAAGVGLAGCATNAAVAPKQTVPFHGAHQAGITTDIQDRLAFAAFDVTTDRREGLVDMLKTWTAAAAAMTVGAMVPGDSHADEMPPADTGEAVGLDPGHLTVTVGFGPSLFDGRFGLAARRPAALADLPALPGEMLDPARSGGDIGIQACANDPQVAFHAVRNLARLGRGTVVTRWTQLGFGRTSATGAQQQTPRNLMGFKDGTRNIRSDDSTALDKHVWVGAEAGQEWMRGGSYLVARRIRMFVETWDRDRLSDQEAVFGRTKYSGAPLTGNTEFETPDFAARTAGGELTIPDNAHIRLAAFENNDGLRILRRGYSFTDGIDARTGTLEAGLFFISFQKDPAQFITLQRKLGKDDALNEYIRHVGSALFACPQGVPDASRYWGHALFEG
ncbi:MAG TPA: iron uptake transporter deferrochelatase/peroxidase subunit [Pseudonocardiaceae bacterium]|jgi:deferrochelatase/peroxidase EfeB|nr:iron uptake transporter deferrochelatase/peroxidase subunit [Pseudonocardiaceae bacterium]